jgi:hypothetical protein
MLFLPLLVLEARSDTKFQLLPLFNIVGPFLGLTKNLGACHISSTQEPFLVIIPSSKYN